MQTSFRSIFYNKNDKMQSSFDKKNDKMQTSFLSISEAFIIPVHMEQYQCVQCSEKTRNNMMMHANFLDLQKVNSSFGGSWLM